MRIGPAATRPLASMLRLIHSMFAFIDAASLSRIARDRTGVDDEQVLGRHVDGSELGPVAALHAVVDVGHGGQQVRKAIQAQLHVVADVAGDVQAGIAAKQVPAIVDVVESG